MKRFEEEEMSSFDEEISFQSPKQDILEAILETRIQEIQEALYPKSSFSDAIERGQGQGHWIFLR